MEFVKGIWSSARTPKNILPLVKYLIFAICFVFFMGSFVSQTDWAVAQDVGDDYPFPGEAMLTIEKECIGGVPDARFTVTESSGMIAPFDIACGIARELLLFDAEYTFTETSSAIGWRLSKVECYDNISYDFDMQFFHEDFAPVDGNSVTIPIGSGDMITCILTNSYDGPPAPIPTDDGSPDPSAMGTLIIQKFCTGEASGHLFRFLESDDEAFIFDLTCGNGQLLTLPVGRYTFVEVPWNLGWQLDSIDCSNTLGQSPLGIRYGQSITIDIEEGAEITCSFFNAYSDPLAATPTPYGGLLSPLPGGTIPPTPTAMPAGGTIPPTPTAAGNTIPSAPTTGNIYIEKEVMSGSDQCFEFSFMEQSNFCLGNADVKVFEDLDPTDGPFTIQEIVPAGWDVTYISCWNIVTGNSVLNSDFTIGDGSPGFEEGDVSVRIDLAAGESVICRFENSRNTDPTVPTVPTVPTAPTVPTVPTVPTAPTVPTVPTAPTVPTVPTDPTVPTVSTVPTMPTVPTAPTAPTVPTVPTVSTVPTMPTTPAVPTDPTDMPPTVATVPTDMPPTVSTVPTVPTDMPPTVSTVPTESTGVPPGQAATTTPVPPITIPTTPTDPMSTDVPLTDVPPTDVPPTDVPSTDVPSTDVPSTDVPSTDVPPTAAPAEPTVIGSNATASVGSRVWLDLNQNGIQDEGDGNVVGVIVHLYTSDGTLVDTQVTDASGEYFFTNLSAGEYYIEFEFPAGFGVTAQDAGASDQLDSDVDPTTGRTDLFTLSENEQNPTLDAGLFLAPTSLETIIEPGMQLPYSFFLPVVGRSQFKQQPTPLDLYAQMYAEIACMLSADLQIHGQEIPADSILGQLQIYCDHTE